ncbi:hypothetical protein TrCOL_g4211 [Triparma columacea]|uniref:CRAL-TRIO domain-containing protein n=1 Tax=Triparma columacea TaxID=722753 RepID=A0A9W7FY01_9STRA|nr:hypothetical protein TrCOL_g4211 [Triparma columacea]
MAALVDPPLTGMESLDGEEASKLTALMAKLNLPPDDPNILEPLADPLTVLRFLRARDGKVDDAAKMYNSTIAFRKTKIYSLMATYGNSSDEFNTDGTRLTPATSWNWTRKTEGNNDAILMQKIGFFGRLTINGPDDAPVAIWRLGACDLFGVKDNDLVDYMCDGFAVHLEDLLQAGRAASLKHNKMVRARLIIDVGGVGMSTLPLLKTLKAIIAVGKQYFPECTATATIINAPWVFSSLWVVVKPILTKVMQRKVCILGTSWVNNPEAFTKHSGITVSALPACLGGSTPDSQVGQCEPVAPNLKYVNSNQL